MSSVREERALTDGSDKFESYFEYLKTISFRGRLYKKFFSSPILFFCARRFGSQILEVGSGTGSGVLGAFPSHVIGIDINPFAVEYTKSIGLRSSVIDHDGSFPVDDEAFDVCILDNVLEHIEDPAKVLDECYRVTGPEGGLVIVVPGLRGFEWDSDHKIFYSEGELKRLDSRWSLTWLFSIPLLVKSEKLSKSMKQYCLVAVFKKKSEKLR
jgi:SAM-dependent methyltransferase